MQSGTGTTVLTGANTYTGGTTITGGTLEVATDGALGGAGGGITLDGGHLAFDGDIGSGRDITLDAGGGTIGPRGSSTVFLSSNISGAGGLTTEGSLVLTGDATHTGGTTVNALGLQIGNGGTAGRADAQPGLRAQPTPR